MCCHFCSRNLTSPDGVSLPDTRLLRSSEGERCLDRNNHNLRVCRGVRIGAIQLGISDHITRVLAKLRVMGSSLSTNGEEPE